MWLGTWQLGRYNTKLADEALTRLRSNKPAMQVSSAEDLENRSLEKIKPVGNFGTQTQIIKHRIRNGKPGYWIIRPFTFKDGSSAMVNIGWYPKAKSENFAKSLDSPKVGWTALVHLLDRNIADLKTRQAGCEECFWESFDVLGLNKKALEKDSMLVLVAGGGKSTGQYPVASFNHVIQPYMTSEKHMGYALTWYGLGFGLVLLFLGAGFGVLGRG